MAQSIEQILIALTEAITANTAALNHQRESAPADSADDGSEPTAPADEVNDAPEKPAKGKKSVNEKPADSADDDLNMSLEDSGDDEAQQKRDQLLELMKAVIAKNRETAKKILAKFGSKTVSSVPEENLDEAIKLAKKYG